MGSATGEFKKGRQEVEEELDEMQGEPTDGEEVTAESEPESSNV
jgi:Sec-independent protein translocase protein TatA